MGEWKSTRATSLAHMLNAASFKGTDTTFGSFPSRLTHVLSETIDNVRVESIVFPAYEVLSMQFRSVIHADVHRKRLKANW